MRPLILAAALAALASPAAAPPHAEGGPFDGRWVSDLSTQDASGQVDDYLLAHGRYECRSCDPPRSYPADGRLRPVTGDPEIASESVAVLGPRAILTTEISLVRVRKVTMTVSADDRTATYVAIDHRTDIPGRLRTEYLAQRIAPPPPGAHRVSGKWRGVRYVSVPEAFRLKEIRQVGERITFTSPRGGAYGAVLDGPFEPLPSGKLLVGVKRTAPRTLTETLKDDDKVVQVRTYALSPDGKSLTTVTTDAVTGARFSSTAHRR